jgi:hypothetical protein
MQTTVGISPKTILAGVLPAVGTVLAILIAWAVTGELDRQELIVGLTGLSSAIVAAAGAYLGQPGQVAPAPADEARDIHEVT